MLYVILLGALLVFWLVAIDRPVLTVQISDGKLLKIKGHIPPSFHHNLKDISERDHITGILKVYQTRSGMLLKFTKSINKKSQQRIRNVFPYQNFKSKGQKKSR
ncbi:hypothetical protein BCU70_16015 [Vibrio sp. 10N.286.49.C2]|uniref:DUF3634 family protein n=1 Tax=unclassified Vibrio TaxID=2614977 RepID=UPI000C8613BA|nr:MULTISPECIES: DUF3634 family protein [unclassified Vibrio]PMH37146.1 hypothetical protein BCU70_16015 [Vibrio sp. 10N.286.49.C2]PMH57291.1 hypothetical protein BCU66_04655 [Vibrio sp. 10N.286.49.B1]PMH83421.1 hypothetical protein BCU58_14795 [Vibrio sp. 10N.286.48.B7]